MANKDTTTTIYNGNHTVKFQNGSHRYYVDGKPRQGVTTIMSKVLAKPGLMLWPLNMALRHIRENIEQVDQGLWQLSESDLDDAAKAHAVKRDAGADTGTEVHALVERLLLGEHFNDLIDEAKSEEVKVAISAFDSWKRTHRPKVVAVEQVVYSEDFGFTGTFDSILKLDGVTYLCDLKTTNASKSAPQGVYAENFIQLGAYYLAYNEQRSFEISDMGKSQLAKIDGLMVISCKKDGKLDVVTNADVDVSLDDAAYLWGCVLGLYSKLNTINKALTTRGK